MVETETTRTRLLGLVDRAIGIIAVACASDDWTLSEHELAYIHSVLDEVKAFQARQAAGGRNPIFSDKSSHC